MHSGLFPREEEEPVVLDSENRRTHPAILTPQPNAMQHPNRRRSKLLSGWEVARLSVRPLRFIPDPKDACHRRRCCSDSPSWVGTMRAAGISSASTLLTIINGVSYNGSTSKAPAVP